MAGGTHYLELSRVAISFDPIDQVESAFFDQSNFQMFCVQHGFTDVRVKGLSEEENFKITIPARGPVSTIKFSGGSPRILSVQRRKQSVEFVNIFAENSVERSLPPKSSSAEIIGFYWIFKNEYVVLVSTVGVELYQCNPYRMTFKLVKSYSLSVAWAIFSPEELVLLACSRGSNLLQAYTFREGSSSVINRLAKFEVEVVSPSSASPPSSSLREPRPSLMERDVVVMRLYGSLYVAVLRSGTPSTPQPPAEVLLYVLSADAPVRLSHILSLDVSGRFTLNVVDNLVVVHHQGWKTSMVFDISHRDEHAAPGLRKHQPVLAPLSIAPTTLDVRQKGNKTRSASSPLSRETSSRKSPRGSPGWYTMRTISPELYSPKWVFFQPSTVVDAQHGVVWRLGLNLEAVSNMMSDKGQLMQFLLMRGRGKEVILNVCRDCLEPGRQANLTVIGGMFDQINHAFKLSSASASSSSLDSEMRYQVVVTQKDLYTHVFAPVSEQSGMPYKYLVAVLVEYIRSLHKLQIVVEHFIFEMVMNILIENRCFYQLHQFLQYHVISDSKPLACLLLSRQLVYPPATQLAMDMFKRLSTADGEIIDILLSRGQILTALRYVKAMEKVDSISARQFLDAAANEGDRMLFYTVYTFFEERNVRLRRKPGFPEAEQCQPYEALYQKWFMRK